MNQTTNNSPQNNTSSEGSRTASALVKLLAIVGLVALLALAAWISVQVIRYTPSVVSSAAGINLTSLFRPGGGPSEQPVALTLSTTSIESNEPFTFNWSADENENGITSPRNYTFAYSCEAGVTVEVQGDNNPEELACETPYNFSTESNGLTIIPRSEQNRFIDVTFTLADESSSDSTLLTLINPDISESPSVFPDDETETDSTPDTPGETTSSDSVESESEPLPTTNPAPQTSTPIPAPEPRTVFVPNTEARENPNGSPDLALSIDAIGNAVNVGVTTRFIPLNEIRQDRPGAVQFSVTNIGDKTMRSGWRFVATLPIEGDQDFTYTSERQEALAPADTIEFTLSFDSVLEDNTGVIAITLRDISGDDTSSNNSDRVVVRIQD